MAGNKIIEEKQLLLLSGKTPLNKVWQLLARRLNGSVNIWSAIEKSTDFDFLTSNTPIGEVNPLGNSCVAHFLTHLEMPYDHKNSELSWTFNYTDKSVSITSFRDSTLMPELQKLAPHFKYAEEFLKPLPTTVFYSEPAFISKLVSQAVNDAEEGAYHAMLLLGALHRNNPKQIRGTTMDSLLDGLELHGFNTHNNGSLRVAINLIQTYDNVSNTLSETELYTASLSEALKIIHSHSNAADYFIATSCNALDVDLHVAHDKDIIAYIASTCLPSDIILQGATVDHIRTDKPRLNMRNG
jgi:hypothetical protein